MADSIIMELDFTGVTPASGGLAVLTLGWHKGAIGDVKHFADTNGGGPGRLAIYMDTAEGRVRESFDLAKGQPFLLALLVSAGVVKESPNKKVKMDLSKLVGKPVHFHYTPPPPSSGAGDTQYAKFRFVDTATFENEIRSAKAKAQTAQVQAPAQEQAPVQTTAVAGRKGTAQPAPAPTATEAAPADNAGDDLDFLS
jgi:hypothetical protein